MHPHRRYSHVHSSSYPSTPGLLSSVTAPFAQVPHHHKAKSESGSISASSHSSPPIHSPVSSSGHPSRTWRFSPHSRSRSRDTSVERTSSPMFSSRHSTPRGTPSPSLFERIRSYPRKNVIPPEQEEQYLTTRARVESAIRHSLILSNVNVAEEMTHDVLRYGAELLKICPFPGLEGVAKVLLGVWDALEKVETNRLACLRLTERCADILISIREEISDLNKRVASALYGPLAKLEIAFQEIENMMLDETQQSPFKRYLRRDDVLEDIANCNTKLQDCLGHFDRSIMLRVLEHNLASKHPPLAMNDVSTEGIDIKEIHKRIREIQKVQNDLDRSRDLIDQQNYTQVPVSSQEVLDNLGIEKKDIPDAVKTLLGTLESLRSSNIFEKVSTSLSSLRRSSTWPVAHTEAIALRLQDRESIERDIRDLKAAYGEPVSTLPSWTITKIEIDLDTIIGRGFFSTVYKGKWGTRVVAVKAVEVYTSKESFVDEVNLWRTLDHPNILPLYGASSVEGTLPWFLVSPLMSHGTMADYLKRIHWNLQRHNESGSTAPDVGHQNVDFLQMMHDVAEGMRYLHQQGIYHGDLKAANVLITEHLHCVVSDFGLSKWINQAEQRNLLPNHALRWRAPELMSGNPVPTNEADVYAFAMCCVEILTMGSMPWPTMKDDDVKQHVLVGKGRPPYPENLVRDLGIGELLHKSWHQSPHSRPSFEELVQSLQILREQVAIPNLVLSSPRVVVSSPSFTETQDRHYKFESPVSHVPEDLHFSPRAEYSTPYIATLDRLESGIEVPYSGESEVQSPLEGNLLTFRLSSDKPPENATVKEPYEDQFEHTYRMCLSHEFPRQLNFPLWTPGDVELGDVGFLSPGGRFMRLFNSVNPPHSSSGRMSIPGVGSVPFAVRHQKDNLVRKGFQAISRLVSTGESESNDRNKRRHTFSLEGGRTAFLCAEKTHHCYIEDSRSCKQWFRKHWRAIIDEYGAEHKLLKEDLMFIIETLNAQHYALFANHGHLDDNVHFDILSYPESNQPWGAFIHPPEPPNGSQRFYFEKVSTTGSPSKTILVARLRFQSDVEEPTFLNI